MGEDQCELRPHPGASQITLPRLQWVGICGSGCDWAERTLLPSFGIL
jgi:hypothetical protein